MSVRGWPGTGEFPRELARLCDHLYQAHGLEMLFLLMQPDKDREATRQVRERMSTPSYVLDAPCTPRELMGVLGKAKLCLAMRLHTLIFAARMRYPPWDWSTTQGGQLPAGAGPAGGRKCRPI